MGGVQSWTDALSCRKSSRVVTFLDEGSRLTQPNNAACSDEM